MVQTLFNPFSLLAMITSQQSEAWAKLTATVAQKAWWRELNNLLLVMLCMFFAVFELHSNHVFDCYCYFFGFVDFNFNPKYKNRVGRQYYFFDVNFIKSWIDTCPTSILSSIKFNNNNTSTSISFRLFPIWYYLNNCEISLHLSIFKIWICI